MLHLSYITNARQDCWYIGIPQISLFLRKEFFWHFQSIHDFNFFCQWKRFFFYTFLLNCSSAAIDKPRMFRLSFHSVHWVMFKYRFKQWFKRWSIFLKQRWIIPLFWKMALSKEKMVFKQMMDNIDEPLPIFTSKSNYFSVNLCARGCLVYIILGILLMEKYWFVLNKPIILMAI